MGKEVHCVVSCDNPRCEEKVVEEYPAMSWDTFGSPETPDGWGLCGKFGMLCPRCLGIELSALWETYPCGSRVMVTEGTGRERGTVAAFNTREGLRHPAVFWDDRSVNDGPDPIAGSGRAQGRYGTIGITLPLAPSLEGEGRP